MAISTAMADSFKAELLQGAHCFNATVTPTASSTSNTAYTAVSSLAGIAVGMAMTGTSVGANSVVAAIGPTNTLTASVASAGTISAAPITFTGDVFKMALIKATSANTYSNLTTNYSVMTGFTDELTNASGGYTAGGVSLVNTTAVLNGSPAQAVVTFSVQPSWTSATFSTIGCMIYNSSARMSGVTGRCAGVFDFGGTQTVTNGTFTVVMPAALSAQAILRIA